MRKKSTYQARLCVVIALRWALRWALLWKLRAAMLTNGDKVFHLSVTAFEASRFRFLRDATFSKRSNLDKIAVLASGGLDFCATQHFRKGPTWIRLRFLQAGVWIAPFWWLTKLTARRSIRSM